MNASIKVWIMAARLRTLPLSIAGILMGTTLAMQEGQFNGTVFVLAVLTTIAFQVLSNFANDYGDGVKGTDNADRVGPQRALGSGALSRKRLKNGIIITIIIGAILSTSLIYKAFGLSQLPKTILFAILGMASMIAAIKYTVGEDAYGYRGMGDLFVFLFFGLLGVLGSKYLYTQSLVITDLLPAVTVGLLSVAVLNLNNMRDLAEDEKVGKRTLAVFLGEKNVKYYHFALLLVAFSCWLSYLMFTNASIPQWGSVLVFAVIGIHLSVVIKVKKLPLLDPELKKVALSTFALCLLFMLITSYTV